MKGFICSTFILMLAVLLAIAIPTDAEAGIYEDTLRLHILANSDSDEDQALKLEIRDRLLRKYSEELSIATDTEEAILSANMLVRDIENDAQKWIRELGYDYSVKAAVVKEWYDTRIYDGFTLPQGTYSSLQITIGNGNGKNWWCVMYPPLCMDIATESAPHDDAVLDYSKEEINLIKGGKYNVKFKLLEIISSAFTKKS